eukprot:1861047-Amphidinium_carterae.1
MQFLEKGCFSCKTIYVGFKVPLFKKLPKDQLPLLADCVVQADFKRHHLSTTRVCVSCVQNMNAHSLWVCPIRLDISDIAEYLQCEIVQAGTVIIKQGDPGAEFFVIQSGEVTRIRHSPLSICPELTISALEDPRELVDERSHHTVTSSVNIGSFTCGGKRECLRRWCPCEEG